MVDYFPEAMPHGELKEVFPDVFFVAGTMRGEFFGSDWQFSRNMIVIREAGLLTIINSVRLTDEGLKALEALGTVKHLVRLGGMHGYDDPFYVNRYEPQYWVTLGMPDDKGLKIDHELDEGGPLPFADASFFRFKTTKIPEGIIRLDRNGGIMLSTDALQNWEQPDEFFKEETVKTMTGMNFFKKANCGVAWLHFSEPQAADISRLKEIQFNHALCGHGAPLLKDAQGHYHATFKELFQV
jgi:hypothetical protein